MVSYSELINIKFLLFLEQLKAGLGLGWDASIRIWIGHQHTDRAPA